ncbi:MAG: hypothetical protein IID32_08415 [Planctomycetes bacterium]|nr:hypothetical protein [Planctomycetota bacterium]
MSKTAPFLSIFAKNGPLFAKNGPKFAKTAPKKAPYGAGSLLRRRFKAKNADREFSKTPKTHISPYKNQKILVVFALEFSHRFLQAQSSEATSFSDLK